MPMKTIIVGVCVSVVAALGGCAVSSENQGLTSSETVSFKVDGMACANCAKHIEEELEAVPGVQAASIDFATKTARVTLDPERPASRDQLDAAVAAWKKEHFSAKEDPECLDPKRREEIKRGQ
ncbi:MAG: cation transporter [Pyrinomonadaceae bacterium]|nr:cation transporter [Phycisphaerales bacterium]